MRAVLVATLFALASSPALAADNPEPKYKGKSLEYWFIRLQNAPTDAEQAVAAAAIVAFGRDAAPAVPELLVMLDDRSKTYRGMIADVLCALGPAAKDAVPALTKRLQEKRGDPEDVLRILCAIGADAKGAIPAIREYIRDTLAAKEELPSGDYGRRDSLGRLAKLGPDVVPLLVELLSIDQTRWDALGCVESLGSKAIKAAPALIPLLKTEDPTTRYRAAVLLWGLDKNPAVVPALAELLKTNATFTDSRRTVFDVETNLAADAAKKLGEIGPDAKNSLPTLREAVVISIPASLLAGVYLDLGTEKRFGEVYISSGSEHYERFIRWRALAIMGRAAAEAIDKIEGKPKK